MRVPILAATAVASLCCGNVIANESTDPVDLNKQLHGEFVGTQTESCVSSVAGFSAAPQLAALGPTGAGNSSNYNVTTYNGDGTFTLEGTGTQIASKFANTSAVVTHPVTQSHYVCNGTYQVNPDGTFELTYSCTGNTLTGSVPGLAFSITGARSGGKILNKKNLLLFNAEPNVEVLSTVYGLVPRVCAVSGNARKTKNDNDD
jgi:hypothetical protein